MFVIRFAVNANVLPPASIAGYGDEEASLMLTAMVALCIILQPFLHHKYPIVAGCVFGAELPGMNSELVRSVKHIIDPPEVVTHRT